MANVQDCSASDGQTLSEHLERLYIKIVCCRSNTESLVDSKLFGPGIPGMYKVPHVLLQQNGDAYRPRIVSIGPHHHQDSGRLHEMEAVKVDYLRSLVERIEEKAVETVLEECVKAMLEVEALVWECYAQLKLSDNSNLSEMMLLDGCFIIELLYRNYIDMPDPILKNHLKCHQVKHDLLLLENQIPFFVLEKLFTLTVEGISEKKREILEKNQGRASLHRCILSFFGDMMGQNLDLAENREVIYSSHILHFLHNCYLSKDGQRLRQRNDAEYKHTRQLRLKHSAKQLNFVGVKFRPRGPRDKSRNLFDLKFTVAGRCFCLCRRGYFKIPCFSINESTESFLRNLIALEQCYPDIGSYFTSHAFLMSILMESSEDVKLLEKAEVIRIDLDSRHNHLDFSEAVSELFKGVSRNTVVGNQFLYSPLCSTVMDFYSPWRLALDNVVVRMTVIAAIILNILTLLSSVYTVLSYYRQTS